MLIGCQTVAESTKAAVVTVAKPNALEDATALNGEKDIILIRNNTACMTIESFDKAMKEQYKEDPKILWIHMNSQTKIASPAVLYHNKKNDTVTVALYIEVIHTMNSKRSRRACLISAGGGLQIKEDTAITKGRRINF